jgi:hypothetical protein
VPHVASPHDVHVITYLLPVDNEEEEEGEEEEEEIFFKDSTLISPPPAYTESGDTLQNYDFTNMLVNNRAALYPNPHNTYFTLEADHQITRIELYDETGRMVHSDRTGRLFKMDTHPARNLPKGLYQLVIYYADEKMEVKRVVRLTR